MAITNEFMEAVQSGKLMRVRIMLKDSLLVDPTATQFSEMEHYATEKMGNIYTEHDGEKLNFDVDAWNEEYLNQQMVTVVTCFSKERVDLLKGMVRYLYKEKANKIRIEANNAHAQGQITRKQKCTGVTVAGAALTVAGVCTAHTALTIGGIVVAVAGIALIVSDKGDA
jgi:hypothetical protein